MRCVLLYASIGGPFDSAKASSRFDAAATAQGMKVVCAITTVSFIGKKELTN